MLKGVSFWRCKFARFQFNRLQPVNHQLVLLVYVRLFNLELLKWHIHLQASNKNHNYNNENDMAGRQNNTHPNEKNESDKIEAKHNSGNDHDNNNYNDGFENPNKRYVDNLADGNLKMFLQNECNSETLVAILRVGKFKTMRSIGQRYKDSKALITVATKANIDDGLEDCGSIGLLYKNLDKESGNGK